MNIARYRVRPYSLAWCLVGSLKLLAGIEAVKDIEKESWER